MYYLFKMKMIQHRIYDVMIEGKNVFHQSINGQLKTYENIRKIATVYGDDCTTGCLLDYTYFKDYYKMIAIDLSKQQVLNADPSAIQQINFTANLDRAGNTVFFIIDEAKETVRFFRRNCKCFVSAILSSATLLNNLIFTTKKGALPQFKCKAIKFTA